MKELEDYAWFPPLLREYQTDFIGQVVARFKVYDPFVQYLKSLNLEFHLMADLCSGSGEPAMSIFKKSNCFSRLILSDKYPKEMVITDERINYETQKTDVLDMEFQRETCYTMFNSFHHFTDVEKQTILSKINSKRANALFVEILEPNFVCLLKIICITTIGTLVLTPFIFPFSLKRWVLTYLFPLNVLTIAIDGIISVFKSRNANYYRKLFATSKYAINVIRIKRFWSPLLVIHLQSKNESV